MSEINDPRRAVDRPLSRRRFVQYGGALGGALTLARVAPAHARAIDPVAAARPLPVLDGRRELDLVIDETAIRVGGRRATATTINGTVPGPLLRFREGDEAVVHVHNRLRGDTSIHWHGLILPNPMDGVPGVNFPGIKPGETFTYRFPLVQYGTYWYHSHSGMQEQKGHYGPLIIDPIEPDPYEYDRELVVMLSDWTFEDPHRIMAKLKKRPDYYNFQKRTVGDFLRDVAEDGLGATVRDRLMWGAMRMNPTDISDITGATYTYLMNGLAPDSNWTGLFQPGERVRLRFINGSAATAFDVRIPGLEMRVVQVSGQNVQPIATDEIRMGIAETYDVIVEPAGNRAYTIFAEAMDRSGFARGTLATREGAEAPVPERRPRPLLTMADMGMAHGGAHAAHAVAAPAADADPHAGHAIPKPAADTARAADPHAGHAMPPRPARGRAPDPHEGHAMPASPAGRTAGMDMRPPGTLPEPTSHGPRDHGPANAGTPDVLRHRLDEPGPGVGEDGWRVLVYTDVKALRQAENFRPPEREIELHLTGNMERFMWSIDGRTFSQAEPIHVGVGERIRLTLVNDTMMNHPMHLHGAWMELENGHGASIPRVHTVNVKPAERLSLLFTMEEPGPWAFHCHVLYHMDAGMFRVFRAGDGPMHEHGGHAHG